MQKSIVRWIVFAPLCFLMSNTSYAAGGFGLVGVPLEFIFFALTLLGVAVFHKHTFNVAMLGLAVVSLYKLVFTGFKTGPGLGGFVLHLGHEWVTLANLFCLLMGFALLARHFEKSHVPAILPKYLPDDWKGGFVLLVIVFVMSAFLDNIAAALIGGTMAYQLFRAKVHIGYIAAIVAAANAGGAGSVVGDTTTTMMWIKGVSPLEVLPAYVAAGAALVVCGVVGAKQQHAYSPILKHTPGQTRVDWPRIFIVLLMLVFAMAANIAVNTTVPAWSAHFPFIGVAVWLAVLLTMKLRRHDWEVLGANLKGTLFLLGLVTIASLMPVEKLPVPSWQTTFGLGFLSAVFDNIPLTALALTQGGYDWGMLAYTVGFGGSMLWFGSSAGVAISNMYPEAKSVGLWLKHGWHVIVAYIVGFILMFGLLGWVPSLKV